jgi:hypothetical protein
VAQHSITRNDCPFGSVLIIVAALAGWLENSPMGVI